MGYKKLITMDVTEIFRRKQQGQSISAISKALGYDRKTIRKYINHLMDIEEPDSPPDAAVIRDVINVSPGRPKDKQELLLPFKEEIEELVNNTAYYLKPKSAFEVICNKHDLSSKVSYSSFKRFIKRHRIRRSHRNQSTCRIEYVPGSEIQIDYCKAGLIYDPQMQKKRIVSAFIGTLSFSRHKYVEFVYT